MIGSSAHGIQQGHFVHGLRQGLQNQISISNQHNFLPAYRRMSISHHFMNRNQRLETLNFIAENRLHFQCVVKRHRRLPVPGKERTDLNKFEFKANESFDSLVSYREHVFAWAPFRPN